MVSCCFYNFILMKKWITIYVNLVLVAYCCAFIFIIAFVLLFNSCAPEMQMSIREYPEHYYYIDMYSNSADSMCILDPDAVVVDCNGATLRMLQCRTRSDLIGTCLLDQLADYDGMLGS